MSRSWRTPSLLWQGPKASGDICWKCRLQLQQRSFHVSRFATPLGPISKNRTNPLDERAVTSPKLANGPLGLARKLSTKNVSLESKHRISREQGSVVIERPSRSLRAGTLPDGSILSERELSSLKASSSYQSTVGLRKIYTGSFSNDWVPQIVVSRAIGKSKQSHDLQTGLPRPSKMMWRTLPSSTLYYICNIGANRKPVSSRREYSTSTVGEPSGSKYASSR